MRQSLCRARSTACVHSCLSEMRSASLHAARSSHETLVGGWRRGPRGGPGCPSRAPRRLVVSQGPPPRHPGAACERYSSRSSVRRPANTLGQLGATTTARTLRHLPGIRHRSASTKQSVASRPLCGSTHTCVNTMRTRMHHSYPSGAESGAVCVNTMRTLAQQP